ncbi:YybH family protein [Georgenia sp. AZ-5]|uniref:YybH family protein n=1 Tax=Georgenia sp. AZ-5 TaxID=3367526 RepID=UPI00375405D0
MDEQVRAWVEGYVRAWNSNDPSDIGGLFTDDAVYLTEPYAEPWRGRQAIVDGWLEHRDEPGQTTFEWRPLVVAHGLAVVQGRTGYHVGDRPIYRNLWVFRLDDDGRCSEFTEWWMREPDGRGAIGDSAQQPEGEPTQHDGEPA